MGATTMQEKASCRRTYDVMYGGISPGHGLNCVRIRRSISTTRSFPNVTAEL